jgi:catechol 2,3-dioxygenase-like lactoylglutathione lyase family enzyme
MFAKINHVATISENYAQLGKFYESMFGMKAADNTRPQRAVTVGDGYVGLNINPRRAGRPARLDHFGIQVEDVEVAFDRMRKKYPKVEWLKRPASRPFAGITTHDPDGNVFDLSQKNMTNRTGVYVSQEDSSQRKQERYISHVAFRTLNPEAMAEFYVDTFELDTRNKAEGDPNYYVTDGHMTLMIMPWHITDYDGTGIVSPGMDHIGFTVESLEQFKKDVDKVSGDNPRLTPSPVGTGSEGAARLELFRKTCPLGQYFMADSDGVLLSVAQA